MIANVFIFFREDGCSDVLHGHLELQDNGEGAIELRTNMSRTYTYNQPGVTFLRKHYFEIYGISNNFEILRNVPREVTMKTNI